MPYDVVLAIITSPELHADHLEVSAQFVGIARDLYVDNEPHELMTRVKTVRIWDNVLPAAESGKLSSRLTTVHGARTSIHTSPHPIHTSPPCPLSQVLDIEWERFNALKSFIVEFVSTGNGGSPFFNQTGTQIKENKMVLQLLQLLFHLIQGGFYPAKDLVEVLPTLIQLLDGRDDKVHEIRRRGRAVPPPPAG